MAEKEAKKDNEMSNPPKGIPYYPGVAPNFTPVTHLGAPINRPYPSYVYFCGISLDDISMIPRVRRCAILTLCSATLLFIISMVMFGIWLVFAPIWHLLLMCCILAFGYSSFYSKRGMLFTFYLVSCVVVALSVLITSISLVFTIGDYNTDIKPWTTAQINHRTSSIWAVFSLSIFIFTISIYLVWYGYNAYKYVCNASLFSFSPNINSWQDTFTVNDQRFTNTGTGFSGVVIGRSVG